MKLCTSVLAMIATSSTFLLTKCGGGPQYSYHDVTITISPQVISIPVNGTQSFTATVTNAQPLAVWLVTGSGISSPVGSFATATTDAPTGTYTAPAAPPIYSATQVASGAVQGSVTLSASTNNSPGGVTFVSTSTTFVITGPISVSLSPATTSLHVGSTQQFTGYAVGSTNNALTWQVNGLPGGGNSIGTITSAGLYTAPATLPMSGNTVTVTAASQADTTKSASSVITLASP